MCVFGVTRFVAVERKPTKRPRLSMDGRAPPWPFPSEEPPVMAETSWVEGVHPSAPRQVSSTYPSGKFVFGTIRFVAADEKATKRPVLLNTGSKLDPLGAAPAAP